MRISIIVAVGSGGVIGRGGQLPWRLPADLKRFKDITTGHPVVMGRKTYESIGTPLPGRTNIVVTRQKKYQAPGCVVVSSFNEAIQGAGTHDELFVVGGAEIYKEALPRAHRIFMTEIGASFSGDAYFPEIHSDEWRVVESREGVSDEKNPYSHRFLVLERRQYTVS